MHIQLSVRRTTGTFHGVRSFASKLALGADLKVKDIQVAMTHGDECTTRSYQAGHELPYQQVEIVFTKEYRQ